MNDAEIEFRKTGFEYVNPAARVVIVGITPGVSQLANDRSGKSPREIKRENAFAGRMRPNLIRMLDYVGVNRLLGIGSCATLWGCDFDKVEMTSLLKEATFVKGKMFNNPALIEKSARLTAAFLNDDGDGRDTACRVAREQARMATRVVDSLMGPHALDGGVVIAG